MIEKKSEQNKREGRSNRHGSIDTEGGTRSTRNPHRVWNSDALVQINQDIKKRNDRSRDQGRNPERSGRGPTILGTKDLDEGT